MNKHRETLMKFIGEQNQRIQNDISKQGYKDDSPYKNNPFNLIQGQPGQPTSITMKGVSTPLMGVDEFGNKQYMQPGQEYQFPGSQVTEIPIAKHGGLLNKTITCKNCGWSWKAADGGNDVSTCHKCGAENKIMQMGGTGMMYADRNYQLGGLKTDDPARKEYAQKVVSLAEDRIRDNNYVTDIPQNVRDASAREGKEPFTCIGGVCTVLKEAGVMPNVNWSNTDFAANAKNYGFTANEGWGVKGLQNLEPGDLIQYKANANKKGKYYPSHSRIFLGTTPEGKYRFFDNQAQSEQLFDKSIIQDWLDPKKNDTQANAVIFKVNPYNNVNPLNLTSEEKQAYEEKKAMIARDSSSPKDYDWNISPDAKNYNPDTKRVMDSFISYANDNEKINELVKKTGKSKKEIQDSLLNVFGELGVENNWTTSKGKGLGSRLENIGESLLTSVGGGKNLSVGPGQIKFNNIPADLRKKFNIKTSNDLYNLDKVLPLMAALDLKDKEVLENWGKKNKLSKNLFGFTNSIETEWVKDKGNVPVGDGFTIKDLPAYNNDDSQLNNTVGRYSPYLRNQYSSIANNTVTTGKNDWIPFNEKTSKNTSSLKTDKDVNTNVKYIREKGSYPYKVEQNWKNNLNRFAVTNDEGAIELPETLIQKQSRGGQFQTGGQNMYAISGQPLITPSQGSYPLSYRDRGNRDTDGTLFSAAKTVNRFDEFGKPLSGMQIRENQKMWNDQKQAYSPEQQAFNIWKNNPENTQQGYFIPSKYEKLMQKFNAQPDVELEGKCDKNFNPTECGISKQHAKDDKAAEAKKQKDGGIIKYQTAGTVTKNFGKILTPKQLELKKQVERNNRKIETQNKYNEYQENKRKDADLENEKAKAKSYVQANMEKAYKSPLMSPGYFTPEGAIVGALQGAFKMPGHIAEGDYKGAAIDALMALPIAIPAAKTLGRVLGPEEGLMGKVSQEVNINRNLSKIKKEGQLQGLSDYEIAKKQMEQVGITSNQRKAYTPIASEFAEKYTLPRGYSGREGETKFKEIIKNIKQGGRDLDSSAREDSWKLYLGRPQTNNTFSLADTAPVNHSAYKPGSLEGTDIYNINPTEILDDIIPSKYNPKELINVMDDNLQFKRDAEIMGGYNTRKVDDNFIQYNDIWDLDIPIAPGRFMNNKITESNLGQKLFFDKTGRPRAINIKADKFLGKPFMSHGNIPVNYKNLQKEGVDDLMSQIKKWELKKSIEKPGKHDDILKNLNNQLNDLSSKSFKQGGSFKDNNELPKAQLGQWFNDIKDKVVNYFSDDEKPIVRPIPVERTLRIKDPRTIRATSQQPINPNTDLVSGNYNSVPLDQTLREAKRKGLTKNDMWKLSSMALAETGLGKKDYNIGQVIAESNFEGTPGPRDFVEAYINKMKTADRLKINDPATRLQVYNGLGTITPRTEKNIRGYEMQKAYGVPLPYSGINLKKNPLYGKNILDLQNNVLKKNPDFVRYIDSIYKAPVYKQGGVMRTKQKKALSWINS